MKDRAKKEILLNNFQNFKQILQQLLKLIKNEFCDSMCEISSKSNTCYILTKLKLCNSIELDKFFKNF